MKKFRTFAGFIALLMALSACYPGAASYEELSFDVQANISKGRVNLTHSVWNAGSMNGGFLDPHGSQGPWGYDRSTSEGTGVASVDFNFTRSNGNWNVTGRWIDGRVQMEFGGRSEYLTALYNFCLSQVSLIADDLQGWSIDGNSWGYDFNADTTCFDGGISPQSLGSLSSSGGIGTNSASRFMNLEWSTWSNGGCVIVPTLYRSLNRDYPGTGHALVLACQNGSGNPVTGGWSNPSYVEVWVPDTTWISDQAIGDINYTWEYNESIDVEYYFTVNHVDNVYYADDYFMDDNSPFRNYYAGGINTNRSAKWTVRARVNLISPAPTQSPLFSYWWYNN